ncbi:MAG: type II toxin-antitoxin system HicA family toxin [Candidatus Absconditabacterales bacterium]
MPRITPLKFREVCEKLKKIGFEGPYGGGKHPIMDNGTIVIPVPHHGGKDVATQTIEEIIHSVGVNKDEWIKL